MYSSRWLWREKFTNSLNLKDADSIFLVNPIAYSTVSYITGVQSLELSAAD